MNDISQDLTPTTPLTIPIDDASDDASDDAIRGTIYSVIDNGNHLTLVVFAENDRVVLLKTPACSIGNKLQCGVHIHHHESQLTTAEFKTIAYRIS